MVELCSGQASAIQTPNRPAHEESASLRIQPVPTPPSVDTFESILVPDQTPAPSFAEPEILAEHAPPIRASRLSPMIAGVIAAAGAVSLIAGLGHSLRSLTSTRVAPKTVAHAKSTPEMDRAHAAALRLSQKIGAMPPAPAAPAQRLAGADTKPVARDVTDSISASAMAPVRPPAPEEIQLFLQARRGVRSVELRDGPGPQYPLIGLAALDERYPIVEWKDRWFRIQLEETPGKTAWVQYDRIEIFSHDLQDSKEDLL
jgi:hypothetical protein